MGLYTRTLAIVLLIASCSIGAALWTHHSDVMPHLHALAERADQRELSRVLSALESARQHLATLSYEHAVWDDMYAYFEDADETMPESNFPAETLRNLQIHQVGLYDRAGRLRWQAELDRNSGQLSPASFEIIAPQRWLPDGETLDQFPVETLSGLGQTSAGPALIAVTPVHRNDGSGAGHGSVVMVRLVDAELARQLSRLLQIPVSLHAIPRPDDQLPTRPREAQRDPQGRLNLALADINGVSLLTLSLRPPPHQFDDRWWRPLVVATATATALVATLLLLCWLRRELLRPLLEIGQHLRQIRESGDYGLRLGRVGRDELQQLAGDIDGLIGQVEQQQQQLQQQAHTLTEMSYQDALTGLANRRRLDQALEDAWKSARREQSPISLMLCDVDFFKRYNDRYGHQQGDAVLRQVSDLTRTTLRRTSDLAARYGGEEFAVLLPHTDRAGAVVVAERLQLALRCAALPHLDSDIGKQLTLSIGVACLQPQRNQHWDVLVLAADQALYRAKHSGRDRVVCAEEPEQDSVAEATQ